MPPERAARRRLIPLLAVALVAGAALWWRAGHDERPPPRPEVARAPEPPPPAPPPPAPVPAPAPRAAPAAPTATAEMDEKLLMARLRTVAKTDSAQAIKLAEEGNRRFADSADAPERESILIHSLANAEHRNEARGRAEFMVNHYPDSDWVREVEAFTGAHRHRNLGVNDAGQLIYQR